MLLLIDAEGLNMTAWMLIRAAAIADGSAVGCRGGVLVIKTWLD